jgi:hypothetical protein
LLDLVKSIGKEAKKKEGEGGEYYLDGLTKG